MLDLLGSSSQSKLNAKTLGKGFFKKVTSREKCSPYPGTIAFLHGNSPRNTNQGFIEDAKH